jgi:hypothetical protein
MKTLLYKLFGNDPFILAFNNAVESHLSKLTFNTRDEYLVWVKQWKEDYNLLVTEYKREFLTFQSQPRKREDKRLIAERRLAKLPPAQPEKLAATKDRIAKQLFAEHGVSTYGSIYILLLYMLVVRRADKIRAGRLRAERIASLTK